MLTLVNSTQRIQLDAETVVRVMRHQPWSCVGDDAVATRLVVCEEEKVTETVLFLEQVILSLPDAYVREHRHRIRHVNGDVWDYRRDNLRVEALQPSKLSGVTPTLHAHTWFVLIRGSKASLKRNLRHTVVGMCASEIEADYYSHRARDISRGQVEKKARKVTAVQKPMMSVERNEQLDRQLECWQQGHAHTRPDPHRVRTPIRCIRRNALGIAMVRIGEVSELHSVSTFALVDDDAYAFVNEHVIPWQLVCGVAFHPSFSLASLVFHRGKVVTIRETAFGSTYVHCNGDVFDFRLANLALRISFQPASVEMRHRFLSDRDHHYVRIRDDGCIEAAKSPHPTLTSGPYPREVREWVAQQAARHFYGASPPAISGSCIACGNSPAPQPAGWIWCNARGLFIGRHHDVSERPPPLPRDLFGVRAITIDSQLRFQAFYEDANQEHDLGIYETAWLAAWTHDAAVLADAAYLAHAPPIAIHGVPRPVGYVYCAHIQRSVYDTVWFAHIFALDQHIHDLESACCSIRKPRSKSSKKKTTKESSHLKPLPLPKRVIQVIEDDDSDDELDQ
jgi:hypothetical protein